MIVSLNVPGSGLLVACVYHPPGSCSNDLLDNFLSLLVFSRQSAVSFVSVGILIFIWMYLVVMGISFHPL